MTLAFYNGTLAEARALAASLPGIAMAALVAMEDADLTATLVLAALDISAAGPYQGQKYDAAQTLEFPRMPYGWPIRVRGMMTPFTEFSAMEGDSLWDWDAQANGGAGAAVVPDAIKIAELFQAAWLSSDAGAAHGNRMDAIRSGLASQGIGTGSEAYLKPADLVALTGAGEGLTERAARLIKQYLLRSGRIL